MKLSNDQINALVTQAQIVNNEKIKKDNDKLRAANKLSVEREAKKYVELLNKIPKDLRNSIGLYDGNIVLSNIIEKVYKIKNIKSNMQVLDHQKLKNEIIIASIDSSDLNELKSKLTIEI